MLEGFLELHLIASGYDASLWWRFFGRLHPVLLHFPIAMLIAAGFVELVLSWRKEARPHVIASFCLWVGMVFAVLATWTGWEMAEYEGIAANPVKADLLEWHRWTGVVLAVLSMLVCLIWLLERLSGRRWAFNAYRYGLWSSAVLVCVVGHFGAEMKWGRDYLFSVLRTKDRPIPQPADPEIEGQGDLTEETSRPVEAPAVAAAAIRWTDQIEPVFASECGDCHGPESQKGGLQLVPYDAFRAHLDLIDQASPMKSILIHRIVLPETDPDAMPPMGDRLSEEQVQIIAQWIREGSPGPDEAAKASSQSPVRHTGESSAMTSNPASSINDLEPSTFDASRQRQAMSAIEMMGGFVAPISKGSLWLDVNLSLIRPPVDDARIKILDDMKETIVWLNLGDTAITDQGVRQTVARLTALRRLRLDRTRITDQGVASLGDLRNLEVLNLFGTQVGDGCLQTLEQLSSLKAVYLWDTHVTSEGLNRLRSVRPMLQVVDGAESTGHTSDAGNASVDHESTSAGS
ncbi:MAG: hypothetical protein CMJ40_09385 [Phycisphaerae bacterium]|nr:hypothetical protein [Phycisphaerae bacterium]